MVKRGVLEGRESGGQRDGGTVGSEARACEAEFGKVRKVVETIG